LVVGSTVFAATVIALPQIGEAQPGRPVVPAVAGPPSTVRDIGATSARPIPVGQRILGVSGSDVTSTNCYLENASQTLCFSVNNGSTDGEWIASVRLTFPTMVGNWQAACKPGFQDQTDSVGYAVNMNCSTPLVNQVLFESADTDGLGEISSGASWNACVDVTIPSGYDGPRVVSWVLSGDDAGSESGSLEMEKCTPLRLTPSQVAIEGCNGMAQALEFTLENYDAGNATVDLHYDAARATFSGPTSLQIQQGEVITFTAQFEPQLCLNPGEMITAGLVVEAGGHVDASFVEQTITEQAGWQRREDSPIPSMDGAVVWASHRDGGLWSIGGYGSDGAAQRFDPASGHWDALQSAVVITPVIEYPMDGCYGLDGPNQDTAHEIVVLFPDTIITDCLHVYDITADGWYTREIPGFFPPGYEGRWGLDIASLLNNPAIQPGIANTNVCYLSGGSTQEGGGRVRDLWLYEPATNGGRFVGNYQAPVWFGFHASWYVPWIGDDGAICVAGGVDHNHQINNTTQCYDIGADAFRDLNADLGTLPEAWWGMADGWQVTDHGYELWVANGVAQDGTLLPASAYFREGMTSFAYGPSIPEGMYRLEGDGWGDQFFTLNGARGGFWYSDFSLQLAACPRCSRVFLPLTLCGD
jgi:hypothetical protein